jgi:hypothetical protein
MQNIHYCQFIKFQTYINYLFIFNGFSKKTRVGTMLTLRNALRNESLLILLIAFFSFSFAEGGCGGGDGGSESTTNFTLEEIVGTYEATEFELIFSDGRIINQDHSGIDYWSGRMTIFSTSYLYKEFNLSLDTSREEGFFTIFSNNRIKLENPDCDSHYIYVTFDEPYMITYRPIETCGSKHSERIKWQKVYKVEPSIEL